MIQPWVRSRQRTVLRLESQCYLGVLLKCLSLHIPVLAHKVLVLAIAGVSTSVHPPGATYSENDEPSPDLPWQEP